MDDTYISVKEASDAEESLNSMKPSLALQH